MTKHDKDRDMRILSFVEDYSATHGYAPSVREIARGVGLASTSAAHHHMTKLRKAGLLDVSAGRARGIRVGVPAADPRSLDLATELLHAPKLDPELPGASVEGRCRRPGCRKEATVGTPPTFCSNSCRSIAWHVRRWLRDAAIESEAVSRTSAA